MTLPWVGTPKPVAGDQSGGRLPWNQIRGGEGAWLRPEYSGVKQTGPRPAEGSVLREGRSLAANLKVLLVGGGGREHALAWKLADSSLVSHVFCAPGNAGTAREPFVTNVDEETLAAASAAALEAAATEAAVEAASAPVPGTAAEPARFDAEDPRAVLALARRLRADLTVIGPEAPLAAGVVDAFNEAGLAIFGPTRAAARLEWSKAFAKDFMAHRGIPTARYAVAETPSEALAAIGRLGTPVVVKADGLAAGKGVTVAPDRKAAEQAVHQAMEEGVFGAAGRRLVVEEGLEGPEVSVLALTDGETVSPFPPAQDHKRLCNGDQGPNTGGMGAYCPARVLGPADERSVLDEVLLPTVRGMAEEGVPLRGVLYAGLMLTRDGPKVLEYNCRFGDPEAQVILPLLEDDLAELMLATLAGGPAGALAQAAAASEEGGHRKAAADPAALAGRRLAVSDGACACVVMASGGYPGRYETGKDISGLEIADLRAGVKVFHAGTKLKGRSGRRVVTAGGRVLDVTATAPTLPGAVEKAYHAVALIRFEGAHFRTDIAAKGP